LQFLSLFSSPFIISLFLYLLKFNLI
jgi:hypothetical protein